MGSMHITPATRIRIALAGSLVLAGAWSLPAAASTPINPQEGNHATAVFYARAVAATDAAASLHVVFPNDGTVATGYLGQSHTPPYTIAGKWTPGVSTLLPGGWRYTRADNFNLTNGVITSDYMTLTPAAPARGTYSPSTAPGTVQLSATPSGTFWRYQPSVATHHALSACWYASPANANNYMDVLNLVGEVFYLSSTPQQNNTPQWFYPMVRRGPNVIVTSTWQQDSPRYVVKEVDTINATTLHFVHTTTTYATGDHTRPIYTESYSVQFSTHHLSPAAPSPRC